MTKQTAPFTTLEGAAKWLSAGQARHGFKEFKDTAEYKKYYPVARALYEERLAVAVAKAEETQQKR